MEMETVQDVLAVIADTRRQIARADALLSRAAGAKPGALALLVDPTMRFRDRMMDDLTNLEAELEKLAL